MRRTIAIGDIHGCLAAFDAILDAVNPTLDDTIVTVGDYVDRGPDSKGVIDRLIELQGKTNLVPLLGNHEEMFLAVLDRRMEPYAWLSHGGVQTMDSYGFTGDLSVVPESHRLFLNNCLNYFEDENHFVVHANYDSELPLSEQPVDLLRWVKLTEMTPPPHFSGKRAIMGHTHDRRGEIVQLPHLVCIDTYCYGGRWLTAIELASGDTWQATPEGELITSPR